MSTVLEEPSAARGDARGWLAWMAIAPGLAALYVPTYVGLAGGLWRDDAYAHGPIILAVFAWLVWRARRALADESSHPAPYAGAGLIAAGLLLYLVGRTQSLAVFEVGSHLPVIAGAVLLVRGVDGLRRLAFPILFLLFLVPLPGFVLDFVTVPLKALVSGVVELMLSALDYPVAREGVVLRVGSHEMLVADACSGLNSLYSLFALGLLYAHVTSRRMARPPGAGRSEGARIALLVLGIIPIAVAANVVRVLVLVLVTYHFGEDAAKGFVHDLTGLALFAIALLLLVAYDRLVCVLLRRDSHWQPREVEFSSGAYPRLTLASPRALRRTTIFAVAAGLAMAGTAAAAPLAKPVADPRPAADLHAVIPSAFGDWRIDPDVAQVAPAPDVQASLDRLYRQIVSRTYVDSRGERMMLTVAYGGDQSDALKAHRQEACYAAQGFDIRFVEHGALAADGRREIPVTRLLAVRGERSEPVTYWFTMGDRVVLGRAERLRVQLEHGLARRVPDGMLVRVSSLSTDMPHAFTSQQAFIAALVAALPAAQRPRFVGAEP